MAKTTTNGVEVEWLDHTPGRKNESYIIEVIKVLQTRPGQWAKIKEFSKKGSSASVSAKRFRERYKGFEFRTSQGVLYGRMLPLDTQEGVETK